MLENQYEQKFDTHYERVRYALDTQSSFSQTAAISNDCIFKKSSVSRLYSDTSLFVELLLNMFFSATNYEGIDKMRVLEHSRIVKNKMEFILCQLLVTVEISKLQRNETTDLPVIMTFLKLRFIKRKMKQFLYCVAK